MTLTRSEPGFDSLCLHITQRLIPHYSSINNCFYIDGKVCYLQIGTQDLESTINSAPCDIVISATPTDINRILKANKSIIRINYELSPVDATLDLRLDCFAREHSGK